MNNNESVMNTSGVFNLNKNQPLNPIADLMAKCNMTEQQLLAAIEKIRSDSEVLKYGHNPRVATFEFPKDALIEKATIADGLISRCVMAEPVKEKPVDLGRRYAHLSEVITDCHHALKLISQIEEAIYDISKITGDDVSSHIDSLGAVEEFIRGKSLSAVDEGKMVRVKLESMW